MSIEKDLAKKAIVKLNIEELKRLDEPLTPTMVIDACDQVAKEYGNKVSIAEIYHQVYVKLNLDFS